MIIDAADDARPHVFGKRDARTCGVKLSAWLLRVEEVCRPFFRYSLWISFVMGPVRSYRRTSFSGLMVYTARSRCVSAFEREGENDREKERAVRHTFVRHLMKRARDGHALERDPANLVRVSSFSAYVARPGGAIRLTESVNVLEGEICQRCDRLGQADGDSSVLGHTESGGAQERSELLGYPVRRGRRRRLARRRLGL